MYKYPHMFSGFQINGMHLKNRIVMAPMGTFSENRNGSPNAKQIEYYRARARGGVGMVLLEGQYTTNKTDPWIDYVTIAGTDEQMQGWALLAEACHAEGAKICLQLSCGLGRNAFPFSDDQMVSASEVPSFYMPDKLCRALTIDEVHDIVEHYRIAARNAVRAEADAVEIHAHAGYMIDQFITPAWNKRTDQYGGSFENRMRLLTEIYHAIRGEVGPGYPVLIRLAAAHDFPEGRTIEETIEIVQYLEKLGIDAFDIDMGCYERKQWIVPSIYAGDACMVDYAAKIKEAVHVPVLSAGTFTPETAEQALADGKCDIVMFGRQLIADPDMPNKLLEDKEEDVRPCLYCNQICVGRLYENRVISCAINAQAVFEADYPIVKTTAPKKVAVVGGGPGGMEAARVAALQGHQVTLYEKSGALGGQINAAEKPVFKRRLKKFNQWQQLQLEKAGVKVCLNHEINADSPELAEAERIIVALGAVPAVPPIPGIDGPGVVNVIDAHLDPSLVKGQSIVVCGGGASGCDCALELAMEGRSVTIIEMMDELAPGMIIDNRNPLIFRLEDYHVKGLTGTKISRIEGGAVYASGRDGAEIRIDADTVITAFGMKPLNAPANEIRDRYTPITTVIGDCGKVAQIGEAVREGFFAAWSIH
ncbi:NAD(P)/FAD-dependent oxidoreductase [Enterocloster lavalensis]|uniref:NAD(P)/FAD-dependent oxidoreductase n=1 Tax=Enterocloster lavalensis TaxID=460384 RepID=UPI002A81BD29|nr:NAD(P)/FAD-dependent oxidoreductase [Enterocloster lavalensis]